MSVTGLWVPSRRDSAPVGQQAKLSCVAAASQDGHIAGVHPNERERWPALVVGAGPAGLATSRELSRRNVAHLILERGDQPGFTWANLYDSLTLHTGRHMSALPGRSHQRGTPLFPTRSHFLQYLHEYADAFRLPVRTQVEVLHCRRDTEDWVVETSAGPLRCSALVMATGIVSSPVVPPFPGLEGFGAPVLHAREYRRPSDVPGTRVLVVGVGNSGGEIASELAAAGRSVDIAVRSGANVVPLTLAGVPIQYWAYALRRLPRRLQTGIADGVRVLGELRRGRSPLPRAAVGPLDAIPLIGFHLVDAIRDGRVHVRGAIQRFMDAGVRFEDGTDVAYDAVILATGYRPALGPVRDLVRVDGRGFAVRTDRVTSADQPGLWFVGHTYDSTGAIANIARDAPRAAAAIARALRSA
jgi:cation diffusion facilitator CzcD-associated flavoprotein CzcO